MFENFNNLVRETKEKMAVKNIEKTKETKKIQEIPFWRDKHKRTTSSGVML